MSLDWPGIGADDEGATRSGERAGVARLKKKLPAPLMEGAPAPESPPKFTSWAVRAFFGSTPMARPWAPCAAS